MPGELASNEAYFLSVTSLCSFPDSPVLTKSFSLFFLISADSFIVPRDPCSFNLKSLSFMKIFDSSWPFFVLTLGLVMPSLADLEGLS